MMGNFNIIITDNYDDMSKKAAEMMAAEMAAKPSGCFGFATGSTPVGMYRHLIALHQAGKADFSQMTTFNLDEYYPMKKDSVLSYNHFMKKNLFDHVNVNFSRVHLPNGETADPQAECEAYEKKIEASGGIDMQLLGVGINGHIGFNEPSDVFSRKTAVENLAQVTLDVNKEKLGNAAELPAQAITMGIKTIMMAKKILLIANGAAKAAIVKAAITGDITPNVPASVLQLHHDVTVVLDKDAAAAIA